MKFNKHTLVGTMRTVTVRRVPYTQNPPYKGEKHDAKRAPRFK